MPHTLIETRAGWIQDPAAIINAVQSAMVSDFGIPERDRSVRLIEHPAERFAVPPGAGERYTIVESKVVKGRPLERKRATYQAIVDNLEKLGVPRADMKIDLVEHSTDDAGIRGGQMLSDVLAQKKR